MAVVCMLIWFFIGYLFWRAVYYGITKSWYIAYSEDYRSSSPAKLWRKMFPIICIAGPTNIIVLCSELRKIAFRHGIVLFFKIPKNTPLSEW